MKTKAMERPVLSYESEKKNLEAQVDLCAERYSRLEERLEGVEVAIKELHKGLMDESKRTGKIIIGASATVIGGVLSTLIAVILVMQ